MIVTPSGHASFFIYMPVKTKNKTKFKLKSTPQVAAHCCIESGWYSVSFRKNGTLATGKLHLETLTVYID